MEVLFVTSNANKVKNAEAALRYFGISVKQVNIALMESRSEDPTEIALEKARQAFRQLGRPVLVEDSGFFIAASGGFPMTHIKFSLNTLGVEKVLKTLEGENNRQAEWRMTAAYVWGTDTYKTFTFVEKGEITTELRPVRRPVMSEYWRIFVPKILPDNQLALSELDDRALADWQSYYQKHNQFAQLGEWLSQQQSNGATTK